LEERRLLAAPMEKIWFRGWQWLGYEGKAFIPLQLLHCLLGAIGAGCIVWLLRSKGASAFVALATGLIIGLGPAWFGNARVAYCHLTNVVFGLLAVAIVLTSPVATLRHGRVLGIIVGLLVGFSALLQLNGLGFLLAVLLAIFVRLGCSFVERATKVCSAAAVALSVIGLSYVVAWNCYVPVEQHPAGFVAWLRAHPELGVMGTGGVSSRNMLRAGAGLLTAIGGSDGVTEYAKSRIFGQPGEVALGAGDWVATVCALAALLVTALGTVKCCSFRNTRTEGYAGVAVVLVYGASAVLWLGSDIWLWLGPVAMLWFLAGIAATHLSGRRPAIEVLFALALLLSCIGAYRQVEAPSLSGNRASPSVESAIAYSRIATSADLLVAFHGGWPSWLNYAYGDRVAYLYQLSFGKDWKARLENQFEATSYGGRIFVAEDVVHPQDVDDLETWDIVAKQNEMSRSSVLAVLGKYGALEPVEFPGSSEKLWQLRVKRAAQFSAMVFGKSRETKR